MELEIKTTEKIIYGNEEEIITKQWVSLDSLKEKIKLIIKNDLEKDCLFQLEELLQALKERRVEEK